jgi:hypothetical protein
VDQLMTRYPCPLDCGWHHDEPFTGDVPDGASEQDLHDLAALASSDVEELLREHFSSHSLEEWVAAVSHLRQQLADRPPLLCLACVVAAHNARNAGEPIPLERPAIVIANGAGICLEHLKISDAPMSGRTKGGLVLPPGTTTGQG